MTSFLGVSDPCCSIEEAAVRMLPVPYEGTVTYGKGTGGGPAAIIEASQQVELYDEYLDCEPWRAGIATLPALEPSASPEAMVQAVEARLDPLVAPGRLAVVLGGEHSISAGAVAAHLNRFPEMGVIQFDAHADLRDSYEGSPWNHACVMSRIYEKVPVRRGLQLGLRSLSAEEALLGRNRGHRLVYARDILRGNIDLAAHLVGLPRHVYITFDVDVFDPSLVRATGTPEPGGLDWYTVLALLEQIFIEKRVIGFDVVELSSGDSVSAFTVARLVYRMIGLWSASRR